jgi:hypothetical protein
VAGGETREATTANTIGGRGEADDDGEDETVVSVPSGSGAAPPLRPSGGTIPVGTIISHTYVIKSLVAAGGMGEVYRAEHLFNSRPYAIKKIRPEFASDADIVELFRREAGILESIENPVIVSYRGLLLDENQHPFIIMEYVDGPSLGDLIGEREFTVEEIRLMRDLLAKALDEVHQRGVVHRDISPDNILFQDGRIDQPRIIDFGIARQEAVATVIGGSFAGKYRYASPEQMGEYGGQVDGRSDIFSLGLVLATAAQGQLMDIGGSLSEILEMRRHVPDLSKVPQALRAELTWMLQPRPDDRPNRASDLVGAEIRLGTESSGQRRQRERDARSAAARGGQNKRRGRGGGGGAVVLVLLLVVLLAGGGAGWWMWSTGSLPEPAVRVLAMVGLSDAPDPGGTEDGPEQPSGASGAVPSFAGGTSDDADGTAPVASTPPAVPDDRPEPDPPQPPAALPAALPAASSSASSSAPSPSTGADPGAAPDTDTQVAVRPPLPDLNLLARQVPCSSLSITREAGGTARVTGFVGAADDLDRLRMRVAESPGVEAIDSTAVEVAPRPLCATLATLEIWDRTDGPRINLSQTDGEYRPGDYLRMEIVPRQPRSHMHVVFIDSDKSLVIHLLPNPARRETATVAGRALTIGSRGDDGGRVYELTEPYGRNMVLAIEAPQPTFTELRPEIEPLQTFLEALLRRKAQFGEQMHLSHAFVDIVR